MVQRVAHNWAPIMPRDVSPGQLMANFEVWSARLAYLIQRRGPYTRIYARPYIYTDVYLYLVLCLHEYLYWAMWPTLYYVFATFNDGHIISWC